MFCDRCDGVLNARFEPFDFDDDGDVRSAHYNHHETLSSLQASIEEGCLICCRLNNQIMLDELIQSFQQNDEDSFTYARIIQSSFDEDTEEEKDSFSLYIHPGRFRGDYPLGLRFRPLSDATMDSSCKEILSYRRFVTSSTNTQESKSLVAHWLDICEQNHIKCLPHKGSDWHPTRLLDLGSLSDSQTERLRIIESQSESPTGPYVTLSHRWGGSDVYKLTKTTYANLRSGVRTQMLPRTFRDAVRATKRGLAVRYLWIDSLCIFQDPDDQSDWLKEALMMHKVYENAFCNLSATGAADSSQGLFFDRRPEQSQPAEVTLTLSHFDPSASAHGYLMVEEGAASRQLESTPLQERGWVFQERLLARRNLHFCCDQLIWECKELYASETYPEGLTNEMLGSPWTTLLNGDPLELGLGDEEFDNYYHDTWCQLVFRYSACKLTVPTDKVVALSGVAKRMHEILQDEYVVGMWRRSLPYQLLWSVLPPSKAKQIACPRDTYLSPSFSWLSTEGIVTMSPWRVQDSILFSVEDIALEYETTDTTGPVKNGHIILHGFVRTMRLYNDPDKQNRTQITIGGVKMNVSRVFWDSRTHQSSFGSSTCPSLDVYCLIARNNMTATSCECLILDYVSSGKFKRIGICTVGPRERISTIVEQFQNEPCIPGISYSAESKKSTIMLI